MLNGARILIVEPDPAYAKVLSILVAEGGGVPTVAPTAERALAAIGELQPDLITVDLILPRMGGLALIEELRTNPLSRHVPVVAVSGYDLQGIEARVLAAGARLFIAKPVSTETFTASLAKLLKRGERHG